jgi:hypothetical protein
MAIRFRLHSVLVLVTIVAVVVVAWVRFVDSRYTLDLTRGHSATCEVHNVSMSVKQVDLTFGMRWSTPMDIARPTLFPHADEPYDTRCCMGTQQTKARVYVCPICSKARATWLRTNTNQAGPLRTASAAY